MADAVVDKPDRRGEILGVSIFLTAFGAVFVLARLGIRMFSSKAFGWDDGFIFGALLAAIAGEGLTITCISNGLGLTISQLDDPGTNIVQVLKYSQFAVLCNGIAMCLMKVAIGLSLIRIRLSKKFNSIVIACIVLSLLVNLTVLFATFLSCRPIEKTWNRAVPGSCWPRKAGTAFSYTQTVGNIVTDLLFSLGPLYFLRKVKVSKYNKWALRGVFMIGLLATACAIAKATELPAIQKTQDPTYDTVDLTIWVKAELTAGLFAASLPPLKSTFESVLVRVFGVHSGFTTPSATRSKGHTYANSHTFRSSRRVPPGSGMGTGFEEEFPHGTPAYIMGDMGKMRKRNDMDEISVEEDQKHILQTGSVKTTTGSDGHADEGHHPDWITKTIEYTVTDSQSARKDKDSS